MRKLLLIGGGGHCGSIIDSIRRINAWDEIGIVDNNKNESLLGVPVVGTDEDMEMLWKLGWKEAFISKGSIGIEDVKVREKLYKNYKSTGFEFPSIIDPSAEIADSAIIKEGVFVGKNVLINAEAFIDNGAIINSGAIVEHNCSIGSFAHISPGTIICGNVCVGAGSHVGAGTVVRQDIVIGEDALIGIGSVVVKNVPSLSTVYGNPCR